MLERGYGLPCPACGTLYSATIETRADPDERQPRILRERRCQHCGHEFETIELVPSAGLRVRLPDPRQRLSQLRRGRYLVERSA